MGREGKMCLFYRQQKCENGQLNHHAEDIVVMTVRRLLLT
jgi:hypothetical protein